MRVFIAHAEADQAAADELKEYLKPNGYFAQTETGARGFGYLQPSDIVIVLWSRHCVFSPYRMQFEQRLLDAWADERLVLVKLDHYFLPVGARDLPAIDASFESARQITAWRDVARRTREQMNALLVKLQEPSTGKVRIDEEFSTGISQPPTPPDPPAPMEGPEDALFVSYAHADDLSVGKVVDMVEDGGRAVWIDKGGIQAGQGWAGEIVRAIKAAGGVLIMCSTRAFESDHVKREVYLADRYKKPILPIFLEAAQPPEDFEYFFAAVQWLELFKLPDGEHQGALAKALAGVV